MARLGVDVTGSLDRLDQRDVYRTDLNADGILSVSIRVSAGDPGTVALAFLSPSGDELSRLALTSGVATLSQAEVAGAAYFAVEGTGAPVSYGVQASLVQGNIGISGATPTSGGPGTLVTISGAGFSTEASETRVLFGGIAGRTLSSASTRIDVVAPANAIDGPLTVISGARRTTGPVFTAGNQASIPEVTVRPHTPILRFDPLNQADVDVTALSVFFDPVVSRNEVDALAASVGATVVGTNTVLNSFEFEIASNRSLTGIANLRVTLEGRPGVRFVVLDWAGETATEIDARSSSAQISPGVPVGAVFDKTGIFDAIDRIRSTPPWNVSPPPLNQQLKVAIVDGGFDPQLPAEFEFGGPSIVKLFTPDGQGVYAETTTYSDISSGPHIGHGTAVTGLIAAVNNVGSAVPISGVLNGLFGPNEQPYNVLVYQAALNGAAIMRSAFTAIAVRNDVDVVNLSWVEKHVYQADYELSKQAWREVLQLMAGRTLVVAASGNSGGSTRLSLPVSLSTELSWLIGVGATNLDGTPASFSASGPAVDVAAVGVSVAVLRSRVNADASGWRLDNGTSLAAPQVAGVAALLLALRPGLSPDALKQILKQTGSSIQASQMKLLNATGAVKTLLPVSPSQPVYVANQAEGSATNPGEVVAIQLDPMTGQPPGQGLNTDTVVPLTFARGGKVFTGRNPTSLVVAPQGDYLYGVVSSLDPRQGDGALVINTANNTAEDFVPFSGARLGDQRPPPPVTVRENRPAMVISPDGRLLYVATGGGLTIINTADRKVVQSFVDLPLEYRALADQFLPNALSQKLSAIRARLFAGVATSGGVERGTAISALTLSPDGKILYLAFETGGGSGYQPGGVIPLSVDLYTDSDANTFGLQSNLAGYLEPAFPGAPVLVMSGAGSASGGDEPSTLAVSRDGKHLYLPNGGRKIILESYQNGG